MIFEKILPLIIIFLIGLFLKKRGILKKEDSQTFGKLLIYLIVPVIIIDSLSSLTFESKLLYLTVAGFLTVFILTVLGFLFAYILKLKGKTRGSFIITFPTFEGGTIGYAFMLSVFGELGLSRIILFDIANGFFLYTVVYFLSCYLGDGKTNVKSAFLKIIKTPLIWAIFIGLFLNIIGFQNIIIQNTFDIIGGSVLVFVMLMFALEFEPSLSSIKLPFLGMILKTTAGLFIGVFLSDLFGFSGIERIAVIVGASLPTSFLTLIYSQENNLDNEYIANLFSISIPFALVFLAVLVGFL